MDKASVAQLIALIVIVLLVVGLFLVKRVVHLATAEIVVPPSLPAAAAQPQIDATPPQAAIAAAAPAPAEGAADDPAAGVVEQPAADESAGSAVAVRATEVTTTYWKGDVVPEGLVHRFPGQTRKQKRTWLASIIVGKDNRTSTSKTVAFAWTLAIVWGLLSLMIAYWLGDSAGWDAQSGLELQDEYLLLLGGPYAAAVLAKGVTAGRTETKSDGDPSDTSAAQLVTDDAGDAELGDLQYVLFNAVALLYFVGAFIDSPDAGFPDLPDLLAGLVLASVAGYSAKKFLKEAAPKMTSVVPPKAAAGGTVQIFGSALTVPASVSESGIAVPPIVTVGGKIIPVTAQDRVLGNDRVTITLPDAIAAGSAPVAVTRADGVAAATSTGENVLAFEVGA